MSGTLSFDVEQRLPVAIARPRGVLDAYTAADLRAGLLRCLADQPSGVVLDTADLSVADDIGLTVLAGVAQQSERWPGARFAMSANPDMTAAAERMGVTRYVKVCPDRDGALKEASQWPVPASLRQNIESDRNAPGVARAAVHEFCAEHLVGGDGDAAQLVASELVTNAVVHAGTAIQLTLRLVAPLLHIAVRDGGDGEARIGGIIDESSESGRGLLLVDAMATSWGTFVPDIGKVVWATVRVRPLGASHEKVA